jgi:hypothetical protein
MVFPFLWSTPTNLFVWHFDFVLKTIHKWLEMLYACMKCISFHMNKITILFRGRKKLKYMYIYRERERNIYIDR